LHDPYSIKMYLMSKSELPMSRFSTVIEGEREQERERCKCDAKQCSVTGVNDSTVVARWENADKCRDATSRQLDRVRVSDHAR